MTTSYARPAGVRISGTGMAVPPRKVSNDDLAKFVDTSDEWIRPRTGIVTRHLCDDNQLTSDLAAEAVLQALGNAGLEPTDLDLLVVSTMTPDVICPATACRVVSKIGAVPCGAMDLSLACTGLVAGLSLAYNFVMSGAYKHVAVIGADRLSTIVNWEDRKTCVLFGDAAGAMVISASDNPNQQCLHQKLNSDGDMGEVLYVPRTESDIPERGKESFNGKFNTLQMNGREVYKFAVNALQECVREALEHTGLGPDDIKMVIPHQSNIRMLQSAWKKMGFPVDKIYINIDRFGNTSAASIGLCMHELTEQGRLEEGDYVIFVAQGGGLTWGASLWRL
jgi:3-oxoacyl-[acyl-carrier-protein] synthase III